MKPILVHIHIFYPELWHDLKKCMQNIAEYPYDLYVTMIEPHKEVEQDILQNFPAAKIEIVENRGYDIGPFIHVLNSVDLNDYSYIIKLHTKRDYVVPFFINKEKMIGSRWRNLLLEPFIKKTNLRKAIKLLENDTVGAVAKGILVLDEIRDMASGLLNAVKNITEEIGLKYQKYVFVAGTMFIAKAELFKCLQHKEQIFQFSLSSQDRNYLDKVYVCERLLGEIIVAQNHKIAALNNDAEYYEKQCNKEQRKENMFFYKKTRKMDDVTEKRYYILYGF